MVSSHVFLVLIRLRCYSIENALINENALFTATEGNPNDIVIFAPPPFRCHHKQVFGIYISPREITQDIEKLAPMAASQHESLFSVTKNARKALTKTIVGI